VVNGKRHVFCCASCARSYERQKRYEQAQRAMELGKAAFNGA